MKSRKNVAKISKIRAWKDQNAYIISYEKTWHEDVVYAPTLYKYCAKYGIPMKKYSDLKRMLEIPNLYLPSNFFGII